MRSGLKNRVAFEMADSDEQQHRVEVVRAGLVDLISTRTPAEVTMTMTVLLSLYSQLDEIAAVKARGEQET